MSSLQFATKVGTTWRESDALKAASFLRIRKNFYRQRNDLIQLVNFQKSQWSDVVYVNVAFWPLALGHPSSMVEYKFPIRGRIENFLPLDGEHGEGIDALIWILDNVITDFHSLRSAYRSGRIKNIAVLPSVENLPLANSDVLET